MTVTAADLVARARSRIHEIPPENVRVCPPTCVLIDVREPAEFAAGHLPGAISIPRGVLEFEVATNPAVANVTDPALADRARHIVVYCLSGGRAALSAAALQDLGYTHVESIKGGIRACIDSGFKLTTHGT